MKKLQQLRKKQKLTLVEASKILGITNVYLSMLESGTRNPSDNLKEKMAKLYKVSIADIFLACKSTKRLKKERSD